MLKKIGVVTALSTALIFGGAFTSSADASAKADQSPVQYKVYYSINGQQVNISQDKVQNLVNNVLNKYKVNGNNVNVEQKEQAKQVEVKQPKKVEQPKQQPKKIEQPQAQAPAKQPVQEQPKQEQPKQTENQNAALSQFEQEVVELTNQERAKAGLGALQIDTELSKVAREKSRDMATNGYFDHNSPTYGSPFDMMKNFGITYRTAGENIAAGQRTPQEVVTAWMNSEGHRANILNGEFTHIGVGYVENGNHWTQQFIGK